ncbi:uncharacterized protein, partial [Diadema antillarum]|uniref:uncharacterized protein n=1 Tax=Diadema antillarum TaxID=105358 RepID=UPI003A83BC72
MEMVEEETEPGKCFGDNMAGVGEGLANSMNMVEEVIVETVMPGDSFFFPEMMQNGVAMETGGAGEIQLQLVEQPEGRIQVLAGADGDIIEIVDETGNLPGVPALSMAGDMAPKQLQILGGEATVEVTTETVEHILEATMLQSAGGRDEEQPSRDQKLTEPSEVVEGKNEIGPSVTMILHTGDEKASSQELGPSAQTAANKDVGSKEFDPPAPTEVDGDLDSQEPLPQALPAADEDASSQELGLPAPTDPATTAPPSAASPQPADVCPPITGISQAPTGGNGEATPIAVFLAMNGKLPPSPSLASSSDECEDPIETPMTYSDDDMEPGNRPTSRRGIAMIIQAADEDTSGWKPWPPSPADRGSTTPPSATTSPQPADECQLMTGSCRTPKALSKAQKTISTEVKKVRTVKKMKKKKGKGDPVNKRDPRKTKVKAKLKTKPESVKKNSLAIKISKRPTKTITMKVAATATTATSIICQFCWREFKKERLYEVHKKTHAKEDEPYVCRYCNSCFEKDSQRNRHMRKKHDYLKCLQCGASFDNRVFFERHMLMHIGQPIMYACKVCGSTFTRKDYLVVHMELHKSEMPAGWDPASILPEDSGAPKKKGTKVKKGTLCCPCCNKSFKTLLLLQKHSLRHKRRFKCQFCPKRFTTRIRRDDHMNVHAENSPYKSQKVLPDKSSSSQHKSCQRIRETGERPDQCAESSLRNHQLPPTELKIECDVCHKKFARKYDMRKHRLTHGGQEHRESKLVRCETCGRGFLNASCLRKHLRGNRCKAKFQCAFCERHFSRKSDCTVHMKEHMGLSDAAPVAEGSQGESKRGSEDRGSEEKEREKKKTESYTCPICGKTLASFKSLTGHYSTHMDKKLFKCDMCDQSYALRRNLRKHKLSHNAINLACRKCNKVFLDKNALQRHMVVHSHEKKYVCDVCDKAFISMAFLIQHKKCHIVRDTRKKPYQCSECERSFLDRNSLRNHQLIHAHGDISRIRKIECEVCHRMFVSSYQMRKHRLTHGGQEHKEERLVRCEQCGRGFLNAGMLRRHQGHKGCRAKYVCAVCKQRFSRRVDLTDHMKEHDAPMDGKWFRCDTCDKSYVKKKYLKIHMLSHSGNKQVCLVCNKIFFSEATLKRHMMTHSGEKPYLCNVCPKAYATKSSYNYHLLMHEGIRSHKCPICDRAFITKKDLTGHIRMVHKVCAAANKPGVWRCRICDKEINSNAEVVEHKNSHVETAKRERVNRQDGKPYSCASCDRSFTKKAFLVRHLLQVHAAEKPFKCDKCDKCYAHPRSLRHHKLVHADARPHLCDICGKSFRDGRSLNKHKQTHLDRRMHACQLCDKRYSNKKGLYRHVKMKHSVGGTTTESHPCKICGKVLTRRAGLVLHMRMHTGEKPFECQTCGNAFVSKQQLVDHTRTHTGEKPFSCKECGQSFALRSTLRGHAVTHTDLRPFVCKICNKAFTDRSTLYSHIR